MVEPRALPPLARELAAVMACDPGAYVSHHSAAAVWGIRPPHAGPVDVAVDRRELHQRDGIRIHNVNTLHRLDIRTFDGIPITSPARTLLDIAPDLSDRELERAHDEGIALSVLTTGAVRGVVAQGAGRPGVARLRGLAYADRETTWTRSEAEERFIALIRKAGLHAPSVNARIGRWEVDFLWRADRVVVEIDGHAYHSARTARERDHRKDAELQHAGYLVIRISARQLRQAPEEVLVQVVRALALSANRSPK